MLKSRFGLVAIALLAAACGRGGFGRTAEVATFRAVGVGSPQDPTVRPARVVPEVVDDSGAFGTESGGGTRAITAGLRVVATREGGIAAADDRLPQTPASTTALPERLGGGFLFVLGSSVWRADRWLGPAKPIYTSPTPIVSVVAGLDRVYLRGASSYSAIDGKTGAALDLGPWPASPYVASFAAADGWRAAAVTDLRGVVTTFDAGATWRVLDLPMDPRQVFASGDGIAVGGVENAKCDNVWFDVRADGSVVKLAAPPREAKGKTMGCAPNPRAYYGGYGAYGGYIPPPPTPTREPTKPEEASKDKEEAPSPGIRIFGKRPIAAAIEDGWPLTDGTAVVARDGALGRVRLADGALTEVVQGAFPLKPARCHAVSLTRPNAVGAFGFVCGEPRGATVVYAYDPMRGALSEIKRFDRPRTVTSSGNGALAVRGGCAEDADIAPSALAMPKLEALKDDKDKDRKDKDEPAKDKEKDKPPAPPVTEVHPYCVLGHDNVWREVHVRSDVAAERVVVLADGKIAVVSPPDGTSPARVTVLDKGKATTVPVAFPKVSGDVARVLRLGVWLDGFEERRPGVLGGWIEAGGAMLGVEITLDGNATPGQFVRDAGLPFVSGRYGFGWTSSRRGYETTDGGMTWTSIDLPEPIVPLGRVDRRACGPIGCVAAGWLRVGWGDAKKKETPTVPPATYRSTSISAATLSLACEPMARTPPTPAAPKPKVVEKEPSARVSPGAIRLNGSSPVLASPTTAFGQPDLPPFFATNAVNLRDAERGVSFDVGELPEHYPKLGSLARLYTWGPKGGDWETLGRFQAKWLSPFAGWPEVKASVPIVPPRFVMDVTRVGSLYGGYPSYNPYSNMWQLATGDDPAHALLFARRMTPAEVVVVELEADRVPVEVHRADGEPFTDLDGVVRTAGRWYVATPPAPGAFPPVTTIWQIDGAVARELARIPRAGIGEAGRSQAAHLARRSDGRAIGFVVDGQPGPERSTNLRWVLPIDLESGQLGEPESLGYTDLGGRTLEACSDDSAGWVLDSSLPGSTVTVRVGNASTGSLHSTYARLRLSSARACVERVAGTWSGQSAERASQLVRPGADRPATTVRSGEVLATALSAQMRYPMRCTIAR